MTPKGAAHVEELTLEEDSRGGGNVGLEQASKVWPKHKIT
jgi:hypothetical protein